MKKIYILQYETDYNESGANILIVADPDDTLPNGNSKIIKMFIGAYADDMIKELTEEAVSNDSK